MFTSRAVHDACTDGHSADHECARGQNQELSEPDRMESCIPVEYAKAVYDLTRRVIEVARENDYEIESRLDGPQRDEYEITISRSDRQRGECLRKPDWVYMFGTVHVVLRKGNDGRGQPFATIDCTILTKDDSRRLLASARTGTTFFTGSIQNAATRRELALSTLEEFQVWFDRVWGVT